MTIQIISYDSSTLEKCMNGITVSEFTKPRSLDEFDINIVDLRHANLWTSDSMEIKTINKILDFDSLKMMLDNACKTTTVIVFPQNTMYRYYKGHDGKYLKTTEIRHILPLLVAKIISRVLPAVVPEQKCSLLYENTVTVIDGMEYKASFNFMDISVQDILLKSKGSAKSAIIQPHKRFIITTLEIFANDRAVVTFLKGCGLITEKEEYPQWLIDYNFLDDTELNNSITTEKAVIKDAENKINIAHKGLEKNLEYKSILFTSGADLVKTVFMILEEILEIDLSEFEDTKKEDFFIPINDATEYIGEIKGVNTNIKKTYVSQLDVHYQTRTDELIESGVKKNTKAILIINTLRNTPPSDREPSHKDPILLAQRNQSLIIDTITLLNIYEFFISGRLSSMNCIDMFNSEIGLLTETVIKKYISN